MTSVVSMATGHRDLLGWAAWHVELGSVASESGQRGIWCLAKWHMGLDMDSLVTEAWTAWPMGLDRVAAGQCCM